MRQKIDINPKEKHLYYFRGSPRPPGTSSKELREPTLERPLFVADNPKGAWSYAVDYGEDNPSIFVLKTKESLAKIAFSFRNISKLQALHRKLPNLVELIDFRRKGNLTGGKSSFWDITVSMVSEFYRILSYKDLHDIDWSQRLTLLVLEELGLVKYSSKEVNIVFPKFKTEVDKDKNTYSGIETRRIIKSRIYEVIQSIGYNVIMDDDTTLSGIRGNEYAVLDKSIFVGGYDKSFSLDDLEEFIFGKKID